MIAAALLQPRVSIYLGNLDLVRKLNGERRRKVNFHGVRRVYDLIPLYRLSNNQFFPLIDKIRAILHRPRRRINRFIVSLKSISKSLLVNKSFLPEIRYA